MRHAATAALLGASLAAGQGAARPMSEIMESGILRACVPAAVPPAGRVIPEGCTGSCGYESNFGELVEAFATSLGLTAEFWVTPDWDALFHNEAGVTDREASYTPQALATDSCDIIGALLTPLDWRLSKVDMACWLPNRMVVVVQRDRLDEYAGIADLAGQTAAVERNMSQHDLIERLNTDALAENPAGFSFVAEADAIGAVDSKDADFTVVATLYALFHTNNLVEEAAVAFPVGPVSRGCWAHKSGDEEMGALIEAFISEQTNAPDSDLNEIWETNYGISFADYIRLISAIEID